VRGGALNLTMYVVALGRLVPLRHWQCQPNGEPSRIEGVTRGQGQGARSPANYKRGSLANWKAAPTISPVKNYRCDLRAEDIAVERRGI